MPDNNAPTALARDQHRHTLSDADIAQSATLLPIVDVARDKLGIEAANLQPYGHTKAKLELPFIRSLESRPDGKLILVTAITPTPAGEGKTTTTVGLSDGLNRIGKKAVACLREPSLGPCFGLKGGAAGGGYAQVVPMTDINLHFTGDFHAITSANNLLAALVDNHIYWGNALGLDTRRVSWRRALDMNDRALRQIVSSLGGVANGYPRDDGFDITVASEVMAIICLSRDLEDLQRRLANIIVGSTRDRKPVRAAELDAAGAMAVLLRDALAPNLVQTLEHNPAFIHGGPFANIAHGCNSVIATRTALKLADYVVTEAGFRRRSGCREVLRHQVPQCRPRTVRRGDRGDHTGTEDAWRRGQGCAQARGYRGGAARLRQSRTPRAQPAQVRRAAGRCRQPLQRGYRGGDGHAAQALRRPGRALRRGGPLGAGRCRRAGSGNRRRRTGGERARRSSACSIPTT